MTKLTPELEEIATAIGATFKHRLGHHSAGLHLSTPVDFKGRPMDYVSISFYESLADEAFEIWPAVMTDGKKTWLTDDPLRHQTLTDLSKILDGAYGDDDEDDSDDGDDSDDSDDDMPGMDDVTGKVDDDEHDLYRPEIIADAVAKVLSDPVVIKMITTRIITECQSISP